MKAKLCFRFNLRSTVGVFMAVLGTLHLTLWPVVTKVAASYSKVGIFDEQMWGWPAVVVVCGAMLLAWGEFCEKGDC